MKKEYDFTAGQRGPLIATPLGKSRITIRLDDDLLGWFKEQVHAAGGGNYQSLINAALREHVAALEGRRSAQKGPEANPKVSSRATNQSGSGPGDST